MRILHKKSALILCLLLVTAAAPGEAALIPNSAGAEATFDVCTTVPGPELGPIGLNVFLEGGLDIDVPFAVVGFG